jgi:CoA:oxalate CoA-transferase
MKQALSGITIIEYGSFITAPYTARLLADFGADVIKIEDPGIGDEARKRGPFPNDIPDPEKSGLFSYLNWNKSGITLNLKESAGKEIFKKLIKNADVLIEDRPPGEMAKLGLDYDSLKVDNPRLIVTSITPFGQTGIYKDYKAYPLNLAHGSGAAYVLPCGDVYLANPDREPIKTGGYIGEYNCAESAVFATVAALYWREISGLGQHVDISKREALASLSRYEFARYNQGFIENRASRSFPVGGLMCCKDGFVEIMLMEKKNWEGLIKLMGSPEWANKPEYQFEKVVKGFGKQEELNPRIKQEVNDYITCWMLEHNKDEIYHQGQACGARDVFESRQLKAREFFVKVDHPQAGTYEYPSWPYKFSEMPLSVCKPAPILGQDNLEICSRLGYTKQEIVQLKAAGII